MKAYLEIEMPTNCAHCMMWSICPALPNGEWPDYESILTNDVIGDGGAAPGIRHPDCPLVPIPPHYDLIDHNALKIAVMNGDFGTRVDFLKHTMDCINKAPVVIPSDMPTYESEDGE